jgi:hypothetical protein
LSDIGFAAFYATLSIVSACALLIPIEIAAHLFPDFSPALHTRTMLPAALIGAVAGLIFMKLGKRWAAIVAIPSIVYLATAFAAFVVQLFAELVAGGRTLYKHLWENGPLVYGWLCWIITIAVAAGILGLVWLEWDRRRTVRSALWMRGVARAFTAAGAFFGAYAIAFPINQRVTAFRPGPVSIVLPWFLVLCASYLVKRFLSQYLGDVAAYVSSNRLDRFSDIRKEVQGIAANVARTVYGSAQYEKVAFVGHSLGSVVAYDTLNRMIVEDALKDGKLDVLRRTPLLLTFGSPLDKTAYVFSTSIKRDDPTRDVLAAAVQPLINDKANRGNLRWVNVWSPNDIISGDLKFYGPVENIEDEDATVPLQAHVAYWENDLIFKIIAGRR